MGRTACTEPQCLYKGALYLTFTLLEGNLTYMISKEQVELRICSPIRIRKVIFVCFYRESPPVGKGLLIHEVS